jgi:hypothetical protein
MLTPEVNVLKPIDPSITNSDDYEIFNLSNAHVSYISNGKPASLLSAYADTPLKVEGKLEAPDRSQLKYLVKKPYRPVEIEIRNVTRFSYGQTEDGEIVIWALGLAGWFELRPAEAYKEIFHDMEQAVQILYFATDIHEESRKNGSGPAAALIFQEYAEDDRFQCQDVARAQRIFHKHRQFLIMCMLNQAQGIRWSNTPLFQYFRRQFPNDVAHAKARISGKEAEQASAATDAESKTNKPKRDKAKSKAADIPKKDDNWWEAAVIWEFMQKAVTQKLVYHNHVTVERIAALMVKRFEIEETRMAEHYILAHASNLCYMMQHPRRRTNRFFIDEPIFTQLSSGHSLSAAQIRKAEQLELRPRKTYQALKGDPSDDEDSSDSGLSDTPRRRLSNKGKFSALRPKSSKFSGKGKAAKRSITPTDALEDSAQDDDSEIEVATPTQGPSPTKRKIEAPETQNPRKRAASASISVSPSSPTSSSSSETSDTAETLPLRWRSANVSKSSTPQLPPVISTRMPSYTANGPGDTWTCTMDGCAQKVYAASEETGRGLIKQHVQEHAEVRRSQIELVMNEEQRLRLPVNNLIRRIREMADQQPNQQPSTSLLGRVIDSAAAGLGLGPTPIERPM